MRYNQQFIIKYLSIVVFYNMLRLNPLTNFGSDIILQTTRNSSRKKRIK